MPITLLHYPVALGLSKLGKKMVLPGLIVGSFIPDIEVPFLIIFFHGVLPDHLILHSLIGAVTIGTILAVIVTRYFYPPLVSKIFRLNRIKLDSKCRLTGNLVLSCMLGNIFHILLDITMHPCNPVLWPWINPNDIIGPLVLFFMVGGDINQGFLIANILTNAIMGIIEIVIILRYRLNLWESLLV